ncbi:MAG TPA: SxtJ family membrane protein [Chitinivibrionales bacterium]
MAAVLICLILGFYAHDPLFFKISIILLVLAIIAPVIFHPFTVWWFWMSERLGMVTSKVLLAILFFVFVTPVGLFRKMMGRDPLRLCQFKKGAQSGLIERKHTYVSNDFENPF